jgi:hypothetical protein
MRLDAGWCAGALRRPRPKYGEGPHITALCLIPFALAFAWLALERKPPRFGWRWPPSSARRWSPTISMAPRRWRFSIRCCCGVSGSPAAIRGIVFPALAIPALAYGLTAFWLVPSYLRITASTTCSTFPKAATCGPSGWPPPWLPFFWRFRGDKRGAGRSAPGRSSPRAVLFFAVNVLGNHFLQFRVMGEPGRLIPELDLVIILGVLAVARMAVAKTPGPR